jgi:hypothetical protein
MTSRLPQIIPEWDDDWVPPQWEAPPVDQGSRRGASEPYQPRITPVRTLADRPSGRSVDLLQLAIAPAVTAILAMALWILTPLPGAGPSPAPLFLIALVQLLAIMATREDRPAPVHRPWLTHLAATVGLLPLMAIQVSLVREPYVALGHGSALPAVIATIVAIGFAIVLAMTTTIRFWRQPDQASLVFLPVALIIPAAIGQRDPISISTALVILALAMGIGSLATAAAAPLPLGMRLLVPPIALALEIGVLWATGRGPVFHPTSGGIVRLLYISMLFSSIILLVVVPVLAVGLRRASATLPPMPSRPAPRG